MRGGKFEQDLSDMAAQPTADVARRYPGLIVGIKTAHFSGPEWIPVERAVDAGTLAMLPVMVDFGANKSERPLSELVTGKLRPGDIYTHMYIGVAWRAGRIRQGQSCPLARAKTRRPVRCRPRRDQLRVAHCGACRQGRLSARRHLHRSARREHERRGSNEMLNVKQNEKRKTKNEKRKTKSENEKYSSADLQVGAGRPA